MALARQVVALGHAARNSANIKLRQPLARALVHLEADAGTLDAGLLELVRDELNVKAVEQVEDVGDLVSYRLLPDNQQLGPRFGARFPRLRAALAALDPLAAARRLRAGLPLRLEMDGEEIELAPGEVLLREEPREGLAVASERNITVAVDVALTPELRAEGLAREVIRRIQTMRKEADLNLDDRIVIAYQAEGELAAALAAWRELLAEETLCVEMKTGEPEVGMHSAEFRIEGDRLRLGLRRAAP